MQASNGRLVTNAEQIVSNYFNAACRIINAFTDKLNTIEAPESLYHYTDAAGLCGIIESGKLRLADIFSLNDPSELKHGLSLAANLWNEPANNYESHFATCFARHLENFHNYDGVEGIGNFFTCSFSTDEDELGQWRAYADDGRGYALEFDSQALVDAFIAPNSYTFPVTYDDSEFENLYESLIKLSIDHFTLLDNALLTTNSNEDLINMSSDITIFTIWAAMFFKHRAYKNETEFRFLQMFANDPMPDIKYRPRQNEFVKYREFDWNNGRQGVLKRIIIGPAADQEKAKHFALECLRRFHVHEVEIAYSKIPYRAPTC
jgi:hypothetical protein